jgi:predicted alpha/beta-hydrolase family hydrolase
MDSPFMDYFSTGLGKRAFRVVRFEYPYMASKRVTGKQKPPSREPVFRETCLKFIEKPGRVGLVIGGKSMGGRIASLVADEAGVAGWCAWAIPSIRSGSQISFELSIYCVLREAGIVR